MRREEEQPTLDIAGAAALKEEIDGKIAALESDISKMTGKDNKKARIERSKELSALRLQFDYIDACKVVKGLEPKHGFFLQAAAPHAPHAPHAPQKAAAAAAEKAISRAAASREKVEGKGEELRKTLCAAAKERKEKPRKTLIAVVKTEREELEALKAEIAERRKQLRESGLSGAQINRDETVMLWATRINELREKVAEKENQVSAAVERKKASPELLAEIKELEGQIDTYRTMLATELKHSKKAISADTDMADMVARLNKLLLRKVRGC